MINVQWTEDLDEIWWKNDDKCRSTAEKKRELRWRLIFFLIYFYYFVIFCGKLHCFPMLFEFPCKLIGNWYNLDTKIRNLNLFQKLEKLIQFGYKHMLSYRVNHTSWLWMKYSFNDYYYDYWWRTRWTIIIKIMDEVLVQRLLLWLFRSSFSLYLSWN